MNKEYTKHDNKLVETATVTHEVGYSYEEIEKNITELEARIALETEQHATTMAGLNETLAQWEARKSEADKLGVEPEEEVSPAKIEE